MIHTLTAQLDTPVEEYKGLYLSCHQVKSEMDHQCVATMRSETEKLIKTIQSKTNAASIPIEQYSLRRSVTFVRNPRQQSSSCSFERLQCVLRDTSRHRRGSTCRCTRSTVHSKKICCKWSTHAILGSKRCDIKVNSVLNSAKSSSGGHRTASLRATLVSAAHEL
jgi:hypothetical protein